MPFKRSERGRPPFRSNKPPPRGVHLAEEDPEMHEDERDYEGTEGTEDEDFEREQEALMAEQYDDEEEVYEEDPDEIEAMEQDALQEAFAAGWRAKDKTAEKRKARGFKQGSRPPDQRKVEDRKKNSTCASSGQKGHWRGDPVCENVRSGKERPIQRRGHPTPITRRVTSELLSTARVDSEAREAPQATSKAGPPERLAKVKEEKETAGANKITITPAFAHGKKELNLKGSIKRERADPGSPQDQPVSRRAKETLAAPEIEPETSGRASVTPNEPREGGKEGELDVHGGLELVVNL